MARKKRQTHEEEVANVLTHGAGILFSLVAIVLLLLKAIPTNDSWIIATVSVYAVCMTMSFSTSTFYHASRSARNKRFLRRLDHSAIYFYIAGTYTPFSLVALRNEGYWGWSLFFIVWIAAAIGVTLSFKHMRKQSHFKTACYLAMGWVVVIAFKPLYDVLHAENQLPVLYWLIGGGLFYTAGSVFFFLDKYKYMHPLWHVFVLGGGICHFVSIYLLI